MTISQQAPKLSPAGVAALDTLLKETVEQRVLPATYFGVAGPDGEIYFNCAGEKVFGQPEHGEVNPDTSECCGSYLCLGDGADDNGTCLSADEPSYPAVLHDEVPGLACCAPARGAGQDRR